MDSLLQATLPPGLVEDEVDSTLRCTSLSRPKKAFGTTDEHFILLSLRPCLSGSGTHKTPRGHEATDTWLPNASVSQATGHCRAKFNQFLVLCINHNWNVPLCTCSQVCSAC